jgi:hypothetical protein
MFMNMSGFPYPDGLLLEMLLTSETLSEICELYIEASCQGSLPLIVNGTIPFDSSSYSSNLKEKLEQLKVKVEYEKSSNSARFELGDSISLYIYTSRKQISLWSSSLNFYIKNNNAENIPAMLSSAADVCRIFLRQGWVRYARLWRLGGHVDCIPKVPITGQKTHFIVTTEAEIEQCYERPEVFWQAGWSAIEEYGDKYLLLRAMNASDNLSFLRETIAHQWNMARVAKPGLNKYYLPRPTPEEMEIFQADDPYLRPTGYAPAEKLVEFACYLEPDEHIQGWEIYDLKALIQARCFSDGRPVDIVRIVFFNREMAEREKRPLLDIGAQVWHYDSLGEIVQITD